MKNDEKPALFIFIRMQLLAFYCSLSLMIITTSGHFDSQHHCNHYKAQAWPLLPLSVL